MQHTKQKHKGFTLFEIMLVMLVVGFGIVAMINYTGRKTQESAADQLGYRLFQYGIAVSDYARQNPDGYDPNNEPEVFYGYEWLQGKSNPETGEPFLGEDFSFDIRPLKILDVETDMDSANPRILKTVLSIDQTGQGGYELVVDLIELGLVTRSATATQQEGGADEYVSDPSLAGAAATYASNYRGRDGQSVIEYQLDEDFADNPQKAHIIGEPKQDVGLSDYWLRTDGGNQMQGPIEFNSTVIPENRTITGVDSIGFTDSSSNVQTLRGFRITSEVGWSTNQNVDYSTTFTSALNFPVHSGNSMCFIVTMQVPSESTDTCAITLSTSNEWYLSMQRTAKTNHDFICKARCIMFDW